MKEKKVCKGCRYLIGKGNGQLEGTCSYCAVNGKSRIDEIAEEMRGAEC